jgi:hypothetical protein
MVTTNGWKSSEVLTPGQTRFQSTFEAIKKMSTGLTTPRADPSPRKSMDGESRGAGYFGDVSAGERKE